MASLGLEPSQMELREERAPSRRFLQSGGLSSPSPLGSRPLVLGHRGSSARFPENTLLAFREAMREGADGVELDVMRCASGEVVVVHDDNLRRVADKVAGSEAAVREMSLATLRSFDVGRGERVPLLSEVFEELGPQALVNVELKSPESPRLAEQVKLLRDDGLAEAVAEVLRQAGRLSRAGRETTLVSSFDPFQLRRFARLTDRTLPLGFLFHRDQGLPLRAGWPARWLKVEAVHPDAALLDAAALRRFRRHGYAVHTWTVDDPREIAALSALGVDAIITNRPERTLAVLEGRYTPEPA